MDAIDRNEIICAYERIGLDPQEFPLKMGNLSRWAVTKDPVTGDVLCKLTSTDTVVRIPKSEVDLSKSSCVISGGRRRRRRRTRRSRGSKKRSSRRHRRSRRHR
jgi:hypothetical protein